jgi:hypothetical protein
MKNIFISIIAIILFSLIACGPSDKEKKAKAFQDSVKLADSLGKITTDVESWDLYKLWIKNKNSLLNKYGNKKIRIKNLVVDNILSDGYSLQCLAFSAKDSMLSNTSQKGDKQKKIAEWLDIVKDIPCKPNVDFTYFFELHMDMPIDTIGIKSKIVKGATLLKKSCFSSIIDVEGSSLKIDASTNSIVLENCKIVKQ